MIVTRRLRITVIITLFLVVFCYTITERARVQHYMTFDLYNGSKLLAVKSFIQSLGNQGAQDSSSRNQCPPEYKLDEKDDLWFRTKISQRSPLGNQTDDNKPYVVILTPLSNSERVLQQYFANLCSFTYPHHLISVVVSEGSSSDNTSALARQHIERLRPYFRRMEFYQMNVTGNSASGIRRHDQHIQFSRRKQIAVARNQLLFKGIQDEKWVLWIDSDVKNIPANVVERLLAIKQQIVVTNCLRREPSGSIVVHDLNSWRETEESKKILAAAKEDHLMVEGYGDHKRSPLFLMHSEGDVVKLDGVGACTLLVDADLHRNGLVFPPVIFDHQIETEGFAKMAAKFGVQAYGLPSVIVIHRVRQ